jgi:hypothetical protein
MACDKRNKNERPTTINGKRTFKKLSTISQLDALEIKCFLLSLHAVRDIINLPYWALAMTQHFLAL